MIVFASVALILMALVAFDVRLKTVFYTIQSEKIDQAVSIALITDLHSCYYGKGQKTLIQAIDRAGPDVVLLGGDIFDDKQPDRHAVALLEGIAHRYPVYYVTGNHEFWREDVASVFTILDQYGVTVLQGETVTFEANGQRLSLSGIDDPDAVFWSQQEAFLMAQLSEAAASREEGLYSILLAHRPSRVDVYLDHGFDLVLSGHAHGGQWRLPFVLNGFLAPDEGFFPRYAGGLYVFDRGRLVVSRGLARESTRVPRIFNRPELVVVTIEGG